MSSTRATVLLLWLFVVIVSSVQPNFSDDLVVNIVSILDETSVSAALLKTHSIVRSTMRPDRLHFLFVVLESENFRVSDWTVAFRECFRVERMSAVVWHRPSALAVLQGDQFEKDIIFSRFYLPHLFPNASRLLYLDNDVIVTMDVAELYHWPMVATDWTSWSVSTTPPSSSFGIGMDRLRYRQPVKPNPSVTSPSTVAMVMETHPFYRNYFSANFNSSHPLVSPIRSRLDRDLFLNAGVFLMDVSRWNRFNFTARAEELILSNSQSRFYSTAVGDQAVFYLLFALKELTALPAQFNMRRLPKKTLHLLQEEKLGIVHFAGMTKVTGPYFCVNPLQYPIMFHAALPLYFSVLHSLNRSCPAFAQRFPVVITDCSAARTMLQEELQRSHISVHYNGGLAPFRWPLPV